MFHSLQGNASVKRYLSHMVASQQVGQALLFSGPDGVGKSLFAKELACHLVGREEGHPDISIYRPHGKVGMHSIDAMRAFSEEVAMQPFSARRKVFTIVDAERMLPYSANALLKTFEEPAEDAVIFLISSHPERLLPTILSRCRHVRFRPLACKELASILQEKGQQFSSELFALAAGSVSRAQALLQPERKEWLERLFRLLGNPLGRYKAFQKELDLLCEPFVIQRAEREKVLQQEMVDLFVDTPSAVQREAIEKEVQGFLAVQQAQDAELLFTLIRIWYRDLYLFFYQGSEAHLSLASQREVYKRYIDTSSLPPLEKIQHDLHTALLSLQRNTSLRAVVETFFLRCHA